MVRDVIHCSCFFQNWHSPGLFKMDQIAKLQKYMQTPEAKKKSSAAKDKAWTRFINQFQMRTRQSLSRKSASMKKIILALKCFSKQARIFCRACLARTENIGASKWKLHLGWIACQVFPINCHRWKTKQHYQFPRLISKRRRRALPKSLTKRPESMRCQTSFSSQNFMTYFNKPGLGTGHRLNWKPG